MIHKCLEGKMSLGLAAFYILKSISYHVFGVVWPMVQWTSRPTSMRADADSNLARDKTFSYFRDV